MCKKDTRYFYAKNRQRLVFYYLAQIKLQVYVFFVITKMVFYEINLVGLGIIAFLLLCTLRLLV